MAPEELFNTMVVIGIPHPTAVSKSRPVIPKAASPMKFTQNLPGAASLAPMISPRPVPRAWDFPWGVATIDLKTPECGHHILFLSQDLQNEGGNSHDDRTGRISARQPMGQARPWEYTYHSRGDGGLGCPVSPGGATRHFGRSGPGLTGRAGRFWPVISAAGAALVVRAGARSGDGQS